MTRDTKGASRDVVRLALLRVAYLMEPDMGSDRLRALVEYVADQDWTATELSHAADVLPRDDQLDQKIRYGGNLTPADFDRVIEEIRGLAEGIKKPMGKAKMRRVIQLEPGITRDDFERVSQPHTDDPDPVMLTESALQAHFDKTRHPHAHQHPDG